MGCQNESGVWEAANNNISEDMQATLEALRSQVHKPSPLLVGSVRQYEEMKADMIHRGIAREGEEITNERIANWVIECLKEARAG